MTIIREGDTLRVSEISELDAAHASTFQNAIDLALPSGVKQIEIDLSRTDFMDCSGVGALVALRKSVERYNTIPTIRLHNPSLPVERMFQLTRVTDIFPVCHGHDSPTTITRAE